MSSSANLLTDNDKDPSMTEDYGSVLTDQNSPFPLDFWRCGNSNGPTNADIGRGESESEYDLSRLSLLCVRNHGSGTPKLSSSDCCFGQEFCMGEDRAIGQKQILDLKDLKSLPDFEKKEYLSPPEFTDLCHISEFGDDKSVASSNRDNEPFEYWRTKNGGVGAARNSPSKRHSIASVSSLTSHPSSNKSFLTMVNKRSHGNSPFLRFKNKRNISVASTLSGLATPTELTPRVIPSPRLSVSSSHSTMTKTSSKPEESPHEGSATEEKFAFWRTENVRNSDLVGKFWRT